MITNATRLKSINGTKKTRRGLDGMLMLQVLYSWCQFVGVDLFVVRIHNAELTGFNQLSDAKDTYFALP